MKQYEEKANIFKALSDENRLKIINMLSKGELCACKILEEFNITQPTLSHHMKVLKDLEIVSSNKQGNWIFYKLNDKKINEIKEFIINISKK